MHYSLSFLVTLLIILVLLSVFFSLSETAMLSLNRYRLRHLVKKNHYLAKRVQRLLERPDRLLGVILLCDTFADMFAASIATLIAIKFLGQDLVLVTTLTLTFIVLIFGEVAPKTLATLYPQTIAFIAAWPLIILLNVLYPLVWIVNILANGALWVLGIKVKPIPIEHLSPDELGTLLRENTGLLAVDDQSMLVRVLELKKATVEDIMIPRQVIIGIDMEDDFSDILRFLKTTPYARLPVYNKTIDQLFGVLYLRNAVTFLAENNLNRSSFLSILETPYYIPEGTTLNNQLLNFKREKYRVGFVLNEYGEIQGLVTLEDILEEIVGDFTTDITEITRTITPQSDGSYLVYGSISLRVLNNLLKSTLPFHRAKTLSGLIIEYLETIPQAGTALYIEGHLIEVLEVHDNRVTKAKIFSKKNILSN